jgi:hypothetical protein
MYPELSYQTTTVYDCPPCGIEWEVRAMFDNGATFALDEDFADICPVCGRIQVDADSYEEVTPEVLRDWRAQLTMRDGKIMEVPVALEWDWALAHQDEE